MQQRGPGHVSCGSRTLARPMFGLGGVSPVAYAGTEGHAVGCGRASGDLRVSGRQGCRVLLSLGRGHRGSPREPARRLLYPESARSCTTGRSRPADKDGTVAADGALYNSAHPLASSAAALHIERRLFAISPEQAAQEPGNQHESGDGSERSGESLRYLRRESCVKCLGGRDCW